MRLPTPRRAPPLRRPFHTALALRSRHPPPPNHYDTLSVAPSATPAQLKTQFYALSKKHHPDLHPADPTATARFARISAAYAALADPRSRALHDAALGLSAPRRAGAGGAGGHGGGHGPGDGRGPAGGRPASGLSSRRRASFYSGRPPAYGSSAKPSSSSAPGPRQPRAPPRAAAGADDPSFAGGGEPRRGGDDGRPLTRDPAIPHWDRAAHFRTHEGIRARAEAARAARAAVPPAASSSSPSPSDGGGPSLPPRDLDDDRPADFALRFLTVVGVVAVGGVGAALLTSFLAGGPPSPPPPAARRRTSGVG